MGIRQWGRKLHSIHLHSGFDECGIDTKYRSTMKYTYYDSRLSTRELLGNLVPNQMQQIQRQKEHGTKCCLECNDRETLAAEFGLMYITELLNS